MEATRLAFIFLVGLSFCFYVGVCEENATTASNSIHSFEFFMPSVIPDSLYNNHLCMQVLIRDTFYIEDRSSVFCGGSMYYSDMKTMMKIYRGRRFLVLYEQVEIRDVADAFSFTSAEADADADFKRLTSAYADADADLYKKLKCWFVGFQPRASMDLVHQMIIYGCTVPGSPEPVWSCNEPPGSLATETDKKERPCLEGSQVLYGWGWNASEFRLPRYTGFRVGSDSPAKYLVLQVHYMRRYKRDGSIMEIDNTGVILSYTKKRMKREAGVLLIGSRGTIPARSVEHLETSCVLRENMTIHPIYFRGHTHKYGTIVSCYVVRQGIEGDEWTVVGKVNSQGTQNFYRVRDVGALHPGDILAARCTINNTSSQTLRIGKTDWDEACNLYLVYWAEREPLVQKYCLSVGPPKYYWSQAIQFFHNIPDMQASIL